MTTSSSGPSGRVVLPTQDAFRRLHPRVIEDPESVRSLLERLAREKIRLRRAMNRRVEPEYAWVTDVQPDHFVLTTRDFEPDQRPSIFLNFRLQGAKYFLSARRVDETRAHEETLVLYHPDAIYCTERRDRRRLPPESPNPSPTAELICKDGESIHGTIEDYSPGGLRVLIPSNGAPADHESLLVRYPGVDAEAAHARIRHRTPAENRPGWVRVGLSVTPSPPRSPFPVEQRRPNAAGRIGLFSRWQLISGAAQATTTGVLRRVARRPAPVPDVQVVRYTNADGEELVGLLDSWGDTRNAPAFVIPPAWGRTKETLLPLARTIVASFRAARLPATVLRFDGIRKRGESFNDPSCRMPGREHHRFTFHQGVKDIQATLDFLQTDPRFRPERTVLITFSASSIEGRRAVALENNRRIHAWICVVGAADIQSMMRVISGGIDYAAGFERGISFGLQEILGVEVDIDHAAKDAAAHDLLFLEDARDDFARITVPVTWFHGRDDAWMDLSRVRDVLSQGTTENRRLIEIPTGHQLKSSRQAMETFQTIVAEGARIGLGRRLHPRIPDLDDLARRSRAERGRRPRADRDLRAFWKDYLLGRNEHSLGIELMHETRAYRELMAAQEAALEIRPGMRVADIGSGPGTFAARICRDAPGSATVRIDSFDFVRSALRRGQERVHPATGFAFVECDIERSGIPARSATYDALLASLFLSYVSDPAAALRDMVRVLKPGGTLVISCLVRDADISRIYQAGVEELSGLLATQELDPRIASRLDRSMRDFLNDAARLLDFEEEGTFTFWEPDDLENLIRRAGCHGISVRRAFGDPPQALVVRAQKPLRGAAPDPRAPVGSAPA